MVANAEESAWLWEFLAFEDQSRKWMPSVRHGKADAFTRLYDRMLNRIPTGVVDLVRDRAPMDGYAIEIEDQRLMPCEWDVQADIAWLRDYQDEGVRLGRQWERGVFDWVTGGGKTEAIIALSQVFPCKTLVIAPSIDLVLQASERYTLRTGKKAGTIGEGKWKPDSRFTVSTFKTLADRLRDEDPVCIAFLDSIEMVLVDEVHLAAADTIFGVLMAMPNAYFRYGFSGTPLQRTDQRSILAVAAVGRVIHKIEPKTLQDLGILATPEIRMVPIDHGDLFRMTYQGLYGEAIVRSTERNRLIVEMCAAADKPALCFVKQVSHGQTITDKLQRAGIKADFAWGDLRSGSRKSSLDALMVGDTDVLVCNVIFQTGIDLPELRSCVIACGGKSPIAVLQRIGRGMRIAPGKTTFQVWDVLDGNQKTLERHAKDRHRVYRSQGYEVEEITRECLQNILKA